MMQSEQTENGKGFYCYEFFVSYPGENRSYIIRGQISKFSRRPSKIRMDVYNVGHPLVMLLLCEIQANEHMKP